MSQSTAASQSRLLWQPTLCLYSVPIPTKESINWSAGVFGPILQCISCVQFQQFKKMIPRYSDHFCLTFLSTNRDIGPTVIKKTNRHISIKFGDIHVLDILNVIGGAKSLDSFLNAFKTSETKTFFPYEWFDNPDKMQNTKLPPYHASYNKFRSCSSWSRIQRLLKREGCQRGIQIHRDAMFI